MKLLRILDRGLAVVGEAISSLCMLSMAVIVTIAVVCRALGVTFNASDELARYMMIWSIYIGIIACTRHNAHVNVEMLMNLSRGKGRQIWEMIIQILIVLLLAWMLKFSWGLVKMAWKSQQTAPITKIHYYFMYMSLPVGFGFSIIRQIQVFVKDFILKKPIDHPNPEEVAL